MNDTDLAAWPAPAPTMPPSMPRGPWKTLPGSIRPARRGQFGYNAGDRLKSPEEMRREWADLMRGGVSADRVADNEAAREKSAPDLEQQKPAPDPAPQPGQAKAQNRDHLAERTAWAERLRGFAADPVQEARREAEPVRTRERTPEPDMPAQPPEKERGGIFQKLRDFVRGWFEKAPRPFMQYKRGGGRAGRGRYFREAVFVPPGAMPRSLKY